MKKKLLSLALALALCLGLAAPASAAGTKKVVEVETHGLKITMNEFLREETHLYNHDVLENIDRLHGVTYEWTICVVADNSTVTVEALPGRKYADPSFLEALKDWLKQLGGGISQDTPGYEEYEAFRKNQNSYAYETPYWEAWIGEANRGDWTDEVNFFVYDFGGVPRPLEKATTITVTPSEPDDPVVLYQGYGTLWLCESDYNRLVPATLQASGWAQEEVAKAYDADLIPFSPYLVDCTRGMTRAEFAAVTVQLYSAMIEKADNWPDVSEDHPFTDVDYETTNYEREIGMAYNLGFVKGSNTAGTLFNPKGTLTRQEAAVMLGRVYAKLHGDIPAVSNTTFADDKDVADWAKSEVAFMSSKEVVKGVGDNRFAPTKTLPIEEAVVMANRMLENLK